MGKCIEFKQGERYYNLEGQAVIYAANVDGKHCVRPVLEDEDGELFEGDITFASKLFTAPPIEHYAKEVSTLTSAIIAKRLELEEVQASLQAAEKEARSRISAIKQHKGLELLEDFLAGRITHLVLCGCGEIVIQEFSKAIKRTDDWSNPVHQIRLLSLFGKSNGDLSWRLNQYSDDSGNWTEVFPCVSMEAARAKVAELLEAAYVEIRKNPNSLDLLDRYRDAAQAIGREIPNDLESMYLRNVIRNGENAAKKNRETASQWERRLMELRVRLTKLERLSEG